jgi:G3E family GTPase
VTPGSADAALIINEFGDVGIDHLLVESSSDGVIELSDGCLCCTVRGELVDTLSDLMDRMQTGRIRPFSRVVIETTGLADPVPVMQSVIGHPALGQSYRLEGLVTVVDAVNGFRRSPSMRKRGGKLRWRIRLSCPKWRWPETLTSSGRNSRRSIHWHG